MGITGLLPVLRPICDKASVSTYRGRRVGIDMNGLLHKGAIACAKDLCEGRPTMVYVQYCMDRVRSLIVDHGVIPVVVLDGGSLPMKKATHADRRAKREEALAKARAAAAIGNDRAAYEQYSRAVPVTAEMAWKLVRRLRADNIEYIVAPYEADAQLAWLALNGHIDCVLTEDSDLVVYGAKSIMYKVNKDGYGDLFKAENLARLEDPPMYNITPDMLMWMCVCAGCDFFPGVRNLGIKRAHALVKKSRTLTRLLHSIRSDQKYKAPRSFVEEFHRACLVFRHQTVYDTKQKKAIHLNVFEDAHVAMLPTGIIPTNNDGTPNLDFIGRRHDDVTMQKIAQGFMNPKTLQEYTEALDVVERPIAAQAPRKERRRSHTPNSFRLLAPSEPSSGASAPASLRRSTAPRPQRMGISFSPLGLAARYKGASNASARATIADPASKVWSKYKRPKSMNDVGGDVCKDLAQSFGINVGETRPQKRPKRESSESPERSPRHSAVDNTPLSPMTRAKLRLTALSNDVRTGGRIPANSRNRIINRFETSTNKVRKEALRSGTIERRRSDSGERRQSVEGDVERPGSDGKSEVAHSKPLQDDGDDEVEEVEVSSEPTVVRSRFFQPGKRLLLPSSSLTATARGRPLVRELAESAADRGVRLRALDRSGRRARGRMVVNKDAANIEKGKRLNTA